MAQLLHAECSGGGGGCMHDALPICVSSSFRWTSAYCVLSFRLLIVCVCWNLFLVQFRDFVSLIFCMYVKQQISIQISF
jgi:hypothetical protein